MPVLLLAVVQTFGFLGYAVAIMWTCARDASLPLAPALIVAAVALLFAGVCGHATRVLVGGLRGSPTRMLRVATCLLFPTLTVVALGLLDVLNVP
ncbi:MAG: hypothetical protein ABI321_21925 [Polyangia bacterium]